MEKLLFISALCVGFSLVATESCSYTRSYSSRYYTSCGSFGWSRCARYRTSYSTSYCTWGTATGWTNVGTCSRSCGGGTIQQRGTRSCTNVNSIPSSCVSKKYQYRNVACNTHNCPVNGGWSGWSSWRNSGSCSESCGDGIQNQIASRTCTNPAPAYNGANCVGSSTMTRTQACKLKECPINGGWSGWSSWRNSGGCSESCGDGIQNQVASRTCTNPAPAYNGANCVGSSTKSKTQACKLKECPIHGGWSSWSSWSNVTTCASCGGGSFEQVRTHTCTNPAPQYDGRQCSGPSSENRTEECGTSPCPVNGGWTDWSDWERQEDSQCSVTCGNGTFTEEKRRSCTNPAPAYGGVECDGEAVETRSVPCNPGECPVDGGWSDWTAWTYDGECPVECGGYSVTETRSRACDSPPPAHGGNYCEGSETETREGECNSDPCPVNGGWTDWSDWERQEDSQCSVTCGNGTFTEEKRRSCTNPAPAYGGAECDGEVVETRSAHCNPGECPVDGGWSEWSEWKAGDYDVNGTSASRTLFRSRTCSSPVPQFGGQMCEGSAEETRNHECHITDCEGICLKSRSNYPNPLRVDAYYKCSENNDDGMVEAQCQKNFYFNKNTCSPICGRTDRGLMTKRTRCGNAVYCIFGMTFPMLCSPYDNQCRACMASI